MYKHSDDNDNDDDDEEEACDDYNTQTHSSHFP